jgi:hypothetical protein
MVPVLEILDLEAGVLILRMTLGLSTRQLREVSKTLPIMRWS